MAFSGAQLTRLGAYGGSRGLYGSFAGKVKAVTGLQWVSVNHPSYTWVTKKLAGSETWVTKKAVSQTWVDEGAV